MTSAKVLLYGNVIGYLRWDERRAAASFEYDTSFVGKGIEPSPLLMPVRQGVSYCLIKLDGVDQGSGFTATQNYGRSEYSFHLL